MKMYLPLILALYGHVLPYELKKKHVFTEIHCFLHFPLCLCFWQSRGCCVSDVLSLSALPMGHSFIVSVLLTLSNLYFYILIFNFQNKFLGGISIIRNHCNNANQRIFVLTFLTLSHQLARYYLSLWCWVVETMKCYGKGNLVLWGLNWWINSVI